jgi:Na+/melibiose symporter-like transporter
MMIGNSLGKVFSDNLSQGMFYTILAVIGFSAALFFLGLRKPEAVAAPQVQEENKDDEETIGATFAIMKDSRMLKLSILSVLLSMSMAVWTSLFVTFYISTMENSNPEWSQ